MTPFETFFVYASISIMACLISYLYTELNHLKEDFEDAEKDKKKY